jgi:hypothetical protein
MDSDFPAAHSMDSCWFAVDRDGHVGYFRTGEAGAMPGSGLSGDAAEDLVDRLLASLPRAEAVHDPRGHALPGQTPGFGDLPEGQNYPVLVFLSSLAPIQSDIEGGRATPVRATHEYAVVLPTVPAALARRLRDAGVVRGWTFYFPRRSGHERADPAEVGIYEYGHVCENWISGPYGRERIPTRPLHVDQLPPNVRRQLKEATLTGLSFADTTYLQPAEHWECQSWEPSWLGLDGTACPFAGREDEHAERLDEVKDILPCLRFEKSEPGPSGPEPEA